MVCDGSIRHSARIFQDSTAEHSTSPTLPRPIRSAFISDRTPAFLQLQHRTQTQKDEFLKVQRGNCPISRTITYGMTHWDNQDLLQGAIEINSGLFHCRRRDNECVAASFKANASSFLTHVRDGNIPPRQNMLALFEPSRH